MSKRRCLRRAEPVGNRKKGKCLQWAPRPAHHKKSDAVKVFQLGEYSHSKSRKRRVKRALRRKRTSVAGWSR